MCLAIPGKVVETYREHDILMGKVEFGGVSRRVCSGARARGRPRRLRAGPRGLRAFAHQRGRGPSRLRVPRKHGSTGRIEGAAMKHLDEYRDRSAVRKLSSAIARIVTRPWTIMEVCGGQTHSIVKYGIDRILPAEVELVHGPGCPVCVTSLEMIDRAMRSPPVPGSSSARLATCSACPVRAATSCSSSREAATSGSSIHRWTP